MAVLVWACFRGAVLAVRGIWGGWLGVGVCSCRGLGWVFWAWLVSSVGLSCWGCELRPLAWGLRPCGLGFVVFASFVGVFGDVCAELLVMVEAYLSPAGPQ